MPRSINSFARVKARFKPQPRILVLCEDAVSSRTYLRDAERHFRAIAEVEITNCDKTDPLGIIKEAARSLKKFNEMHCVIDRDSHHGFDMALKLAAKEGVQVVASYPCYEFWLLLHFRKTRSPHMAAGNASAADRLIATLRVEAGMQDYAKGRPDGLFASLLRRLPDARQRSIEVLAEAVEDKEMNPSTQLHVLMDLFERLGKPIAAN